MEENNKKRNNILSVIIIAAVFGIAGGVVGELIAKAYLLDNPYIPFFSELNFSGGNMKGANLIINNAKKVVIEQDARATELIASADSSLVGVFKKITVKNQAPDKFNSGDYYRLDKEIGQGFIITSDGWIITAFSPPEMEQAEKTGKQDYLNNYAIITKDGEIYPIDNIIRDKTTKFNFLHVPAGDFSVKEFADYDEIKNGQTMAAIGWDGKSRLATVSEKTSAPAESVGDSDISLRGFNLGEELNENFKGSVIFCLSGEIAGFIGDQGEITPINRLAAAINSLLKNKAIKRASLGANYINLSRMVMAGDQPQAGNYSSGALVYKNKQGIAVVKNSAAESAGLKEGDIIISIDGVTINQDNDLADMIQRHIAGDKIRISYARVGKTYDVEIVLGEIKQ